ncbi:hypothetical protein [Galbibacter mesophilus]|uniref:hypothetical protein n=1 Tax=Galbibacter mesophilus TaxID=379069 RepID=UPI00191F6073|nr:hypothetical protein [Galbibacter mesophilus]MCM5663414.1 hypothetical protein [Galbibacter mesophilus]
MKNIFKITGLNYDNDGKTIRYGYSYSASVGKYFHSKNIFYATYEIDVRQVPESIAIIPLLANIAPIAWFAGFEIEVDEIDSDFYHSLELIKKEFAKTYPDINNNPSIYANKIVVNQKTGQRKALLFSGGVDAYASYFRHEKDNPSLITIHGADIPIKDHEQWNNAKRLTNNETILKDNTKHYITTNVRDFYTYQVSMLLKDLAWWGRIQHGLSLTGVTAPLAYIFGYETLYIASTHTKKIQIPWGSSPFTDNLISWSGLQVVHDAYELERLDKIELIISQLQQNHKKAILRVCYSELNNGDNCSKCEKCLRTMFAIILFNGNPNDYGFKADSTIYESILKIISKDFTTKGIYHHWQQLISQIDLSKPFYVFEDVEKEKQYLKQIQNTSLSSAIQEKRELSKLEKLKFLLRNKFAPQYRLYLNLRQQGL